MRSQWNGRIDLVDNSLDIEKNGIFFMFQNEEMSIDAVFNTWDLMPPCVIATKLYLYKLSV